jgi:hypothetical protein
MKTRTIAARIATPKNSRLVGNRYIAAYSQQRSSTAKIKKEEVSKDITIIAPKSARLRARSMASSNQANTITVVKKEENMEDTKTSLYGQQVSSLQPTYCGPELKTVELDDRKKELYSLECLISKVPGAKQRNK